jgi:hypothetical protein
LDVDSARKEVERVTKRLGYVVQTKGVIENGVKGLRVWRLRG